MRFLAVLLFAAGAHGEWWVPPDDSGSTASWKVQSVQQEHGDCWAHSLALQVHHHLPMHTTPEPLTWGPWPFDYRLPYDKSIASTVERFAHRMLWLEPARDVGLVATVPAYDAIADCARNLFPNSDRLFQMGANVGQMSGLFGRKECPLLRPYRLAQVNPDHVRAALQVQPVMVAEFTIGHVYNLVAMTQDGFYTVADSATGTLLQVPSSTFAAWALNRQFFVVRPATDVFHATTHTRVSVTEQAAESAADNTARLIVWVLAHPTILACALASCIIGLSFRRTGVAVCLAASVSYVGGYWYVGTALAMGGAGLTAAIVLAAVVRTAGRYVTVVGPQHGIDVNAAKDFVAEYFRREMVRRPVRPVRGQHLLLAAERRTMEAAAFALLYQSGAERVRDVGGSRTRHAHLGHRKHLCAPVILNSDILREEKNDHVFENCGRYGQECPAKTTIPHAVLSHVDYHLTPAGILECVTGPTIIINHSFEGVEGDFGAIPARDEDEEPAWEAHWTKIDGRIRMGTEDGTPYAHGYNQWQAEGEIVAAGRAAVYTRLFRADNTDMYLVIPSRGTYDAHEPTVLRRAPIGAAQRITVGHEELTIQLDGQEHVYYREDGSVRCRIPADLMVHLGVQLAQTRRDDRFLACVNSFTNSRLISVSPDLALHAPVAVAHVIHLANEHALAMLNAPRMYGLDPATATWADFAIARAADWVRSLPWAPIAAAKWLATARPIVAVARVLGVVHLVAPYEVFTPRAVCQMTGHRQRFRFPDEPPAANAGADRGAERRAVEEPEQRRELGGAQGGERGPDAAPRADDGPGAGAPADVEQPPAPAGPADAGAVVPEADEDGGPAPVEVEDAGANDGRLPAEDERDAPPPAPAAGLEQVPWAADLAAGEHWHFEDGYPDLPEPRHVRPDFANAFAEGRHVVRVRCADAGGEQVVDVPVRAHVPPVQLTNAVAMLRDFPRVQKRNLLCAVRAALRAVGVVVLACGRAHHADHCYMLRVYPLPEGTQPALGYRAAILGGVAVQVPAVEADPAGRGERDRVVVRGPNIEGLRGQMFPQERDNDHHDRPAQHLPPNGRIPRGARPARRGGRR